jgi:MarR family transcriptional regulator, organic hydroperoxide resistance regulator
VPPRPKATTIPPPGPPLGEVLEFMRLTWAVFHGLQSTSKKMAKTLGVTGPQRLVIRLLGQRPGTSAGELADLLHLHPSTITGILRRLEERGFLRRKAAEDDRRRAVLTLSTAGKGLDELRSGTVEAAVRRTLESAGADDVAATRRVLERLAVELGGGDTPDPE